MGIQCFPLCGNCSCRKCALGSKGLSIKEEREQALVNQGLSYQENDNCFVGVSKIQWSCQGIIIWHFEDYKIQKDGY